MPIPLRINTHGQLDPSGLLVRARKSKSGGLSLRNCPKWLAVRGDFVFVGGPVKIGKGSLLAKNSRMPLLRVLDLIE
ncbi:hypothetical protein GCM10027290_36520 [Micromonospora sonneratiae]|uniref:Uncharacterized protein n=1 Tax=Micromonospora sonneratiae TaxID=1184706 RepID=A0ABW3YG96_9ACTN